MISYLVRIYLKAKVLDVEFLGQSASFVKDMTMVCSADGQHTPPSAVMSVPVSPEACHRHLSHLDLSPSLRSIFTILPLPLLG